MQLEQELLEATEALDQIQRHLHASEGFGLSHPSRQRDLRATAGCDIMGVAWQVIQSYSDHRISIKATTAPFADLRLTRLIV